jgi:broad specificity phosphatase PhoE
MFYLIRHGETDWNADRRLQGQLDTSLSLRGREQPREAARILANVYSDVAGSGFIASPLSRARHSMDILMRELVALGALGAPMPYATDDRLKELSFGRWEGFTWKEVRRDDQPDYAARNADIWNIAPPGGESYASLATRAGPLLRSLPRGTVVVSHGGVSRVALHLFAKLPERQAATAPIRQGDVLVVDEGGARWGSGAALLAETD